MKFIIVVEVDDRIVEKMGKEKVQEVLDGWVQESHNHEEILKESWEDGTGEWIET